MVERIDLSASAAATFARLEELERVIANGLKDTKLDGDTLGKLLDEALKHLEGVAAEIRGRREELETMACLRKSPSEISAREIQLLTEIHKLGEHRGNLQDLRSELCKAMDQLAEVAF